ncbi:MAG TPA: radical SAM protein [Clostridia bacterium]|nr:radical SAM protein [Clostridia bacterium]
MGKGIVIYPVFVPMVGCPHQCVFCNQRAITGKSVSNLLVDIESQIKANMDTALIRNGIKEIAFFGGSFTCLSIELQNTILKLAHPYLESGFINGIRISTRPDYLSKEVIDNLHNKKVTTIELGIQSTNSHVLNASERGYTYEDIQPALQDLKGYDFNIGLQMMAGLPYDTRLKSIRTALDFVRMGPDFVRIYPTLVVKGAPLEESFLEGQYKPLSLDDAVEWVRDIRIIFEANDIDVIRTGLQSQEGFDQGQDLVAGPYHPAFGEMVESSIYGLWMKKIIRSLVHERDGGSHKDIIFQVHPNRLSQVMGNRKSNILDIHRGFGNYRISIYQDESVDKRDIELLIDESWVSYNRKSFISEEYKGILKEMEN